MNESIVSLNINIPNKKNQFNKKGEASVGDFSGVLFFVFFGFLDLAI